MAARPTIPTVRKKWGIEDVFAQNKLIYIFCAGEEEFPIRCQNVPCFAVLARQIHFSFVDNVSARYGALIVDGNRAWKGQDEIHFHVPQLVSVEESCFSTVIIVIDYSVLLLRICKLFRGFLVSIIVQN